MLRKRWLINVYVDDYEWFKKTANTLNLSIMDLIDLVFSIYRKDEDLIRKELIKTQVHSQLDRIQKQQEELKKKENDLKRQLALENAHSEGDLRKS